jgi:UDP-N-acetylglucosamine--N-acetylmuramyl-(pentapeptide) pyrophosphoryl-undecaprenol N-acetylglucosamine transferase
MEYVIGMTHSNPLLISAGGTGGGVYPALAVVEALRRIAPECPLHFVGAVGGMEQTLVPRNLFAGYHEVRSGPLNGVGVVRAMIGALKILLGTIQAWLLVGQIRPSLLFLTGGWATFPAALACWLRRVPIVIFLPDVEPARTIKVMSRLARVVMATTSDSASYFDSSVQVIGTGYPLRSSVINATRSAAIEHFHLDQGLKTLLVFGGSRGARSINNALEGILSDLLADGLQILHITGELDWPTVQARYEALSPTQKAHYHPFAYLHEDMGLALAAADLAVSRAGASTLGEFPQFGLPSILIPLAFAWRYQRVNADWLAARGAAIRLDDELLSEKLLPTIRSIIGDPARLEAMHKASAALQHDDAAGEIARQLLAISDH